MTLTPPVVELFINAAWVDITALGHVYTDSPITITRGRGDGSGSFEPSRCSLTFNDADGRYSPRNPASPWFGQIGRATDIRVTDAGSARFIGEISSMTPQWNLSGTVRTVLVDAAGALRRIGQGTQPSSPGLKQFLLGTSPITYWPLDDGPTATEGAPAKGTYKGSTFRKIGAVAMDFAEGSLATYMTPSLRLNDTTTTGVVLGYTTGSQAAPNALAWDFVYKANPESDTSTAPNMAAWFFDARIEGTAAGSYDEWELQFRKDGVNDDIALELHLDVFGGGSTVALANTAPLGAITDGLLHHIRLKLIQTGADVDYAVYVDGALVISGTRTTHNLFRAYSVQTRYDRAVGQDLLAFGHLIVWEQTANIPAIADAALAAAGYAGETAGDRFIRLCTAAGEAFTLVGSAAVSTRMGIQYTDAFTAQLAEIETTDGGMIDESRTAAGPRYHTRTSLYSQSAAVTLSYAGKQLAPPLQPVDDDQTIRNDIFAQRRDGSSFQATLLTGPLSVQDFPNGVGRYKDEQQVNVQTDGQLEGVANWLLHKGTVDAARYPSLTVDLAAPDVANNPSLLAAIRAIDIGSRILIVNAQAVNIYDPIDLLVVGYTEVFGTGSHPITFNASPYAPYDIAKWGSAVGSGPDRFDTAASQLASSATATATSLSVASTANTLWTTVAGEFPFDITVAGERMTVTNIIGATSPQTFTVTRSVNGVIKAQASGAAVRLWKTPRYGL